MYASSLGPDDIEAMVWCLVLLAAFGTLYELLRQAVVRRYAAWRFKMLALVIERQEQYVGLLETAWLNHPFDEYYDTWQRELARLERLRASVPRGTIMR